MIFSLLCTAQKKSRIVFFRMDMPIGPESSSFKEVSNFTNDLKRNGETISTLHSPSVFIYETDSISGSYYLDAKPGSKGTLQKAVIAVPEGTVAFVRISIGDVEEAICYAEVLDFTEFQEYYNSASWQRKKLELRGFKSAKQLTYGYKLMPPVPKASHQFNLAKINRSFTDTTFLGIFDIPANSHTATTFGVATKDNDGSIRITDYYTSTGKIKSTGRYLSLDSESKTGTFEEYYASGNISSKGLYKDNHREGHWEYYYDTTGNPLWYEFTYAEGYEEGMLKSYYPSGKIKREEQHHSIAETVEYGPRKARHTSVFRRDSIFSGKCFDEGGQPIKFSRFETMPKARYDINSSLAKHIRYPDLARENNIEGRVVVRFRVDEQGDLQDITIMKGVSENINREAINAVKAMHNWTPAIRDDKPTSMDFTLPITFKLE